MLRRAATGGALWALDSYGASRTRLGRSILCALGVSGSIYRSAAAGDSYVYRAAGGNCAHAPRALSCLHFSRLVALVLCLGLAGDEAGRELARTGKIFPQVRCGDWSRAGSGGRLFCLEPLAESSQRSRVSCQRPVGAGWLSIIGFASCEATICHLPSRFIT